MSRWRTVKTPPDSNRYVLIYGRIGIQIGYYTDDLRWYTQGGDNTHPSYWMPLPRKPKVKK